MAVKLQGLAKQADALRKSINTLDKFLTSNEYKDVPERWQREHNPAWRVVEQGIAQGIIKRTPKGNYTIPIKKEYTAEESKLIRKLSKMETRSPRSLRNQAKKSAETLAKNLYEQIPIETIQDITEGLTDKEADKQLKKVQKELRAASDLYIKAFIAFNKNKNNTRSFDSQQIMDAVDEMVKESDKTGTNALIAEFNKILDEEKDTSIVAAVRSFYLKLRKKEEEDRKKKKDQVNGGVIYEK
mgnify:CR=1 FL=1